MGWLTTILGIFLVLLSQLPPAWGQARPTPPPADQAAAPNRPGWSVDTRGGCWIWNPFPQTGEAVSWSGGCDATGRATGTGVVEWHFAGKADRGEVEYVAGKKHGRGVYRFANGNRYVGDFADDKFHGQGTMTLAKGGVYEGEWRDGKANGRGVFKFTDGSRYDGQWVDDQATGHGVMTRPDGNWYEGQWQNGRPNGRGVYTRIDGSRFAGDWRDGCFRDGHGSRVAIGRPLGECP